MTIKFNLNWIFAIVLLFLVPQLIGATPIEPGNGKAENTKKRKQASRKNKRKLNNTFKLHSDIESKEEVAHHLYIASFVGAIISIVSPFIASAIVSTGILGAIAIETGILFFLGLTVFASIFVIIGIIASIFAIKLKRNPNFTGSKKIYWKALTLTILSGITSVGIILISLSGPILLLFLLVSLGAGIAHFFAANAVKAQKNKE